jgi:hypothetical protein
MYLRRPFTPEAIKWKVQSNFGEKGCLVVGYIDARLVIERLNLLLPALWYDRYTPLDGSFVQCELTVDGVTRIDVGQGAGKAGYSDALKRAGVKFGVGVSLYAIPRAELWVDQHGSYVKSRKNKKGELVFDITAAGDAALRDRYAKWLDTPSGQNFGEPLDHGDVEGAAGDVDVAGDETGELEDEERPILQLLEGEQAEGLREEARRLYGDLVEMVGRSSYPPGQFQAGLESHGHSLEALAEFVGQLEERIVKAQKARAAA